MKGWPTSPAERALRTELEAARERISALTVLVDLAASALDPGTFKDWYVEAAKIATGRP